MAYLAREGDVCNLVFGGACTGTTRLVLYLCVVSSQMLCKIDGKDTGVLYVIIKFQS